jgi:hypothetical protein
MLEAVIPLASVVLVLEAGIDIHWAAEHVPRSPNLDREQRRQRVTDVLFGDVNPGGKFFELAPHPRAGYTTTTISPMSGGSADFLAVLGCFEQAALSVGYGLSYTTFKFDHLQLSKQA